MSLNMGLLIYDLEYIFYNTNIWLLYLKDKQKEAEKNYPSTKIVFSTRISVYSNTYQQWGLLLHKG